MWNIKNRHSPYSYSTTVSLLHAYWDNCWDMEITQYTAVNQSMFSKGTKQFIQLMAVSWLLSISALAVKIMVNGVYIILVVVEDLCCAQPDNHFGPTF